MDSNVNSKSKDKISKHLEENILLQLVKEVTSEKSQDVSANLKRKVHEIIANCDLTHYLGLHKLSTADESTSNLLGLVHQKSSDLTYEEQTELNGAIIKKIETYIPALTKELDALKWKNLSRTSRLEQINQLQEGLDDKLNMLQEQENEKVELMMEWLNLRSQDIVKFSDNTAELLALKTKILDLKSKILHLQVLQNIFTETNQSIKSYTEVHKDLEEAIKETEERIREYNKIIENDRL